MCTKQQALCYDTREGALPVKKESFGWVKLIGAMGAALSFSIAIFLRQYV